MTLNITEGTAVFTADDEKVGSVDRVVIDALTHEVSHIVVHKGVFFPEDKVIPIHEIATATADRIDLRWAASADEFPPFEEEHYVPLSSEEYVGTAGQQVWPHPIIYYGPHGAPTPVLQSTMRTVAERNIPERAVALQGRAPVFTRGGEKIGRFVEVVTTDTGIPTHLVIEETGLGAGRKAIPISWLESVTDDEVRIAVSRGMIETIPEYFGT